MRKGKKHMDKDSRVSIEEGIYGGKSCRSIALSLNVSPSTVSREVEANRTVVEPPRKPGAKLGVRCANYRDCRMVGGACGECKSRYVLCKDCRTKSCIDACPSFELRMCERVGKWPRKRKKPTGRTRVDRTGRLYSDFLALPLEERARAVQGDSVEGFEWNRHDILSLHVVARKFQLYLRKRHADAEATVALFDRLERAMGSRGAFRAAFDPLLLDRGVEFDDFEGIERSCLEPGAKRCRVFYCDAQESNQKSQAERNHEQLRRILPKGRTDMDRMSDADVAECCSHVNSYPLASLGGLSPFECLGALVPMKALAKLGIRALPRQAVVLRPSLMRHAVEQ